MRLRLGALMALVALAMPAGAAPRLLERGLADPTMDLRAPVPALEPGGGDSVGHERVPAPLACLASGVVPGLGQLLEGRTYPALGFFLGWMALYGIGGQLVAAGSTGGERSLVMPGLALIVGGFAVAVWSMADAWTGAAEPDDDGVVDAKPVVRLERDETRR